jgi:hypothetical protein
VVVRDRHAGLRLQAHRRLLLKAMRSCLGLAIASCLAGCGARTELPDPKPPGMPDTPSYCQNVASPPLVVVTDKSHLYRFDPPSAAFALIGTIACPESSTPETMAVDYQGTAFVTYQDGAMFEVSPDATTCTPTTFSDGQNNGRFGSCFAALPGGQGEALFLLDATGSPTGELVSVDTKTFAVEKVGPLSASIGGGELTGTGDGRLFAFTNQGGTLGPLASTLAELDPTSGSVVTMVPVDVPIVAGWAFAFWGGSFYFFTGTGTGDSTVARLDTDGTFVADYATLPGEDIVGAGVSTCAPTH